MGLILSYKQTNKTNKIKVSEKPYKNPDVKLQPSTGQEV